MSYRLKALLGAVLALSLLMQCSGVCLWSCLLQHSHDHQHHTSAPGDCHYPVVSAASTAGPAPSLSIPAPAALADHRFTATIAPLTLPEPVALPFLALPEPEPPPPRG